MLWQPIRTAPFDRELELAVIDGDGHLGMRKRAGKLGVLRDDLSEHPLPAGKSGIGLRNVHERIQLTCGSEYGLTIHSVEEEGTTIYVRLPREMEVTE